MIQILTNSTPVQKTHITSPFYFENVYIDPIKNIIIEKEQPRHLQPKVMEVLAYLCSKPEEIVTTDELITTCWPNQYIGDSPVHKCIAQIRKALNDSSKNPLYIKTIPKRGYIAIGKIKPLIEKVTLPTIPKTKHKPYLGTATFTQNHHKLFFGRNQHINNIVSWASQITAEDSAWLLLSAPIGAGKSSLVHAGLLPHFLSLPCIEKNEIYCQYDITQITHLPHNKASTQPLYEILLNNLLEHTQLSCDVSINEYIKTLENETDNLTVLPNIYIKNNNEQNMQQHQRFILFIDHIDEIFTYNEKTTEKEKQETVKFFTLLYFLARSKHCVLITTLQEHNLPAFNKFSFIQPLLFHYKLPELGHNELTEIIQKPAKLAGLHFEYNKEHQQQLDHVILQQWQESPMPIVVTQALLATLYQHKAQQCLTYQTFYNSKGFIGCLTHIAEQQYVKLNHDEQTCFNQILFHLLTLNLHDQRVIIAKPSPLIQITCKTQHQLITRFARLGVFKLTLKNNQVFICFSHNELLKHWSRMTEWINQHIATLYIRYDLQVNTQRWLYSQKSQHLLIDSHQKIKQINTALYSNNVILTTNETLFITTSQKKLSRHNKIKKSLLCSLFICFMSLGWLSFSLIQKNEQITTTRNNAENLISFILYDLKDKLEPLGKLELLNIVAEKTLHYFELAGTDNLTGSSLHQWIEALHIVGTVHLNKNNYTVANTYFKQSEKALQNLLVPSNNSNNTKSLELYMLTHYWLGYTAYIQKDYKTAQPYFLEYLHYTNQLIQQSKDTQWTLEKSYALNNLGALSEKIQHLEQANNYFSQSAQLKQTLIKKTPDNNIIRADLADTLSWQGNIHKKKGKLLIATRFINQALSQVNYIYHSDKSFSVIKDLAILQFKAATLYYDYSDLQQTEHHAQKSAQLFIRLTDNDRDNYTFKKDLMLSQLLLAKTYFHQHQFDQALTYIEQTTKLMNTLKSNSAITKELIHPRIYLLRLQAKLMAALQQKKAALTVINNAITLFNKHLSTHYDLALYSSLQLAKAHFINTNYAQLPSVNQAELTELHMLLEQQITPTLSSSPKDKLNEYQDYRTLSFYVALSHYMEKKPTNSLLLQLYKQSDYNSPDAILYKKQQAYPHKQ